MLVLLTSYGMMFGLRNKADWLTSRLTRWSFFESMLQCSYCTGFHTGWLTALLCGVLGWWDMPWDVLQTPLALVCWAFASAAFCYIADSLVYAAETLVYNRSGS
jgi:hypothetical protein